MDCSRMPLRPPSISSMPRHPSRGRTPRDEGADVQVHLIGTLVVDPGLDEVRCEDVAPQQELVVLFQGVQHLLQGAGDLGDLSGVLWR